MVARAVLPSPMNEYTDADEDLKVLMAKAATAPVLIVVIQLASIIARSLPFRPSYRSSSAFKEGFS